MTTDNAMKTHQPDPMVRADNEAGIAGIRNLAQHRIDVAAEEVSGFIENANRMLDQVRQRQVQVETHYIRSRAALQHRFEDESRRVDREHARDSRRLLDMEHKLLAMLGGTLMDAVNAKREKFKRIANGRANRAIKAIRILANMGAGRAASSYEFAGEDVEAIVAILHAEVERLRQIMRPPGHQLDIEDVFKDSDR